MANYLLAYHGGGTPEGEEAQAAVMQAWNDWLEETGEAMLDLGNPVKDARVIGADGSVSAAPANQVTGYSIIEADDMDDAIAIAKGCPILADGGSVEVAELVDMMDFDDEDDDDDEDEDDDEE